MTTLQSSSPDFLDLSDAVCPICLYIFIEPILLPCEHRFCGPCFHSNLELTSLSCPLCKKRVGSWARRNKKGLIDRPFWERVQKEFPKEVSARLSGTSTSCEDEAFLTFPHHQFASQGEIHQEFVSEIERFRREERSQRAEEESKSQEFIQRLLEEETARKAKEEEENEARSLALIQELSQEEDEEAKKMQISEEMRIQELSRNKKMASSPKPKPTAVSASPKRNTPRQLSLKESLARASRIA